MSISASLSSPTFFGQSVSAFSQATRNVSYSTNRIATGNRIYPISTDIASLSIASRLRSQVNSLKVAQTGTSLGSSFLQVAYDGLSQVRDLLARQKVLAVQSSSGSLTDADRTLLQAEFAAVAEEIDRLAGSTRFGEITLLDGSVSGENAASTTTSNATAASASLNFTGNPTAGQTVIINGVTLVADTDFTVGVTTAATVNNLKTALNNSTDPRLSQAVFDNPGGGTILSITQRAGGKAGNQFTINQAASTASFATSGATTQVANFFTLSGGANDGLRAGSVSSTGTIGDSLVTAQSQQKASVTLTLSGAAADGETLSIDNGNGGLTAFTFRTTATLSTDIQIGADTEETLQNVAKTLSAYAGTDNFGTRQLEFQRDGNQLVIRNQVAGDPGDFTGADLDISETLANGSLSAASFSNGSNTGVNTTGVTNAAFTGTIGGFSATYNSADDITAQITVGDSTYTAEINDTTPATATSIRFTSTSGGYFDVQIAASGQAVTNQTDADNFAARLDGAFATLDFSQSRNVSSFSGTGTLVGGKAELQLTDFDNVRIDRISVTAPTSPTGDAVIEIDVNGETFRSSAGIGGSLGVNETITLTSTEDAQKVLKITGGSSGVSDFSTTNLAATFEDTLRDSFGLDGSGTGLSFQVGTESTDTLNVTIGDVRTNKLYAGTTPDIGTLAAATTAQDTIDDALERVDTIIANVGATQGRFDAAFSNLDSARFSIDIARSELEDTDIAEESTKLASETLKANFSLSVIAQTTRLQSSLLQLLKVAA